MDDALLSPLSEREQLSSPPSERESWFPPSSHGQRRTFPTRQLRLPRRCEDPPRKLDPRSLGLRSPRTLARGRKRHRTWQNTRRPRKRVATANRRHQNGTRFTLQWFSTAMPVGRETLHAPWLLGSLNASAPPLTAHPATSISNWLSASLFHSTVTPRVPFCDVSVCLPRGTLPFVGIR